MALPPNFPSFHSCQHCETFILDPSSPERLFDTLNKSHKWILFIPELTVGRLRELAKDGCGLCEYILQQIGNYDFDDGTPILYSLIEESIQNKTGFERIRFGVPKSKRKISITDLKQKGVKVYNWWEHNLLAASGRYSCPTLVTANTDSFRNRCFRDHSSQSDKHRAQLRQIFRVDQTLVSSVS